MIFLADENIDSEIVQRLRSDGHQVLSIAEMQPSIPDAAVLSLANTRKAVLLTSDKDFGELVFRQKRLHSGIILIRLAGLQSHEKANQISSVIHRHKDKLASSFTVITADSVRFRLGTL